MELTPTHHRILDMLANEYDYEDIARDCKTTVGAIRTAVYRLKNAFGAHTTIQLLIMSGRLKRR